MSIDGFGVLHVRAGAQLEQTNIRVCVRQLNVGDSCRNIGLNQRPPLDVAGNFEEPPPAEGEGSPNPPSGGNIAVPLAIAGGAGIGGYMMLNEYLPNLTGGCSPADPSPGQACVGQGNTAACLTAQAEQDSFCQCEGFSGFDNRTGGCF